MTAPASKNIFHSGAPASSVRLTFLQEKQSERAILETHNQLLAEPEVTRVLQQKSQNSSIVTREGSKIVLEEEYALSESLCNAFISLQDTSVFSRANAFNETFFQKK